MAFSLTTTAGYMYTLNVKPPPCKFLVCGGVVCFAFDSVVLGTRVPDNTREEKREEWRLGPRIKFRMIQLGRHT